MWNHFKKIGRQYYLTDWEGNLLQQMETVGLVFRIRPNKAIDLVGYGHAATVQANFSFEPEANHKLIFFKGKFKVEDLNKLVSDDSYAEVFYNQLLEEYKNERDNI